MELTFPDRPSLPLDRPRIMGILNVTPDSFSDGGAYDGDAGVASAVATGLEMAREGAAIIDVGGESTRPGAARVVAEEQIARVTPVIAKLRPTLDAAGFGHVVISIDTTLAAVGEAALEVGASMLNDVAAGREDPDMLTLAAGRGVPMVLMHMLGEPGTMQDDPRYEDVVGEVHQFLRQRAMVAEAAGVPRGQIVLDPGIGFGKTMEHNLALLANLGRLVSAGYPVLLGASRKGFIAKVEAAGGRLSSPPSDRVGGTVATTALAVAAGVRLLRVHDVAPNRQAADVTAAVMRHVAQP